MIGLPLYDMQETWTQHNKHVVLPKKSRHITPLPPHNSNLSTTGSFFCPQDCHCEEIQLYIYNNFFSVEIIH